MMFAPWPSRLQRARLGLRRLVALRVAGDDLERHGPDAPCALTCLTRPCAAASAGSSNGAMCPCCRTPSRSRSAWPAADADPATTTATTAIAASDARSARERSLRSSPSLDPPVRLRSRAGRSHEYDSSFALIRRYERRVEGSVDAVALRLAHERAGDQIDLGAPACFDVLQHRWIVRAAPPRGEHVHLPRVVVQLDPGRRGDRLALVDQVVDEMAEIGRVARAPRSASRAAGR